MCATRISPWILVLSLAVVVPSTSDVRAADHDFSTNIVYRLLSVEEVNGQLVIEAVGTGQSSLLGSVTAAATVIESEVPDPCFSYSADFLLIATAGAIEIHSGGTVCPTPPQITGQWTVTGGTGAFLHATGSGAEEGKQSFTGNDPVVDRLRGTLSYNDEDPAAPLSSWDCYGLLFEYEQAFREAYVSCDPLKNPQSQCRKEVMNSPVCGCPYHVDQSNHRALMIMEVVLQAFCDGSCNTHWSCTDHRCGLGFYGDICVDGGP